MTDLEALVRNDCEVILDEQDVDDVIGVNGAISDTFVNVPSSGTELNILQF